MDVERFATEESDMFLLSMGLRGRCGVRIVITDVDVDDIFCDRRPAWLTNGNETRLVTARASVIFGHDQRRCPPELVLLEVLCYLGGPKENYFDMQ